MRTIAFMYAKGSGFSGQQYASELLADGLRHRGWSVRVINTPALDRGSFLMSTRRPPGFEGLSDGSARVGAAPFAGRLLHAWLKGLQAISSGGILHVNPGQTKVGLIRDSFPLLSAPRLSRHAPVVVSIHGSFLLRWGSRSIEARMFRRIAEVASYVTVLGPITRDYLVQLGVPARKVMIVDNTCEQVPLGEDACLAKHMSSDGGAMRVLYLSSLIETKGYPEFIEAVAWLASNTTLPIEVTLCGQVVLADRPIRFSHAGDAIEWIHRQMSAINSSRTVRIRWIDGAVGARKAQLLRDAHVFVLPSRYSTEAQPISIIEALANGCVVVTSKVGEIPSTVSAETAVLLDDASDTEIATTISDLYSNPHLRSQLALNAVALFRRRFDYSSHITRWEEVLAGLVSKS